ncbi:hypothetical protein [Burkholderia diffusa]|uniref:hypothetical protein n=1 Tax=Burkholderia diffusa TaxID=488732 RepID=UPI0008414BE0|nr:hypothetical protein [Burkholderia diffusa]AOI56452.1 hypothetical protein WI26_01965 [Burkholderia diffusa]
MSGVDRLRPDHVLAMVRKAVPLCMALPLLGAGISYAAYTDELSISTWPWRIGVLVALGCCTGLLLIHLRYRGTNELFAYGLVMSLGTFATYYFFGIFGYFCFFIFAPMPALARWPGLSGGIVLNIFWAAIAYRSVCHTVEATPFVGNVFDDRGEFVVYDVQRGVTEFERHHKEPSAIPKFGRHIVFGLAPLYLILGRLLSSGFGANGVLLFWAVMSMPLALLFVSLFVRNYVLMIALPKRIEKQRGKRVLVAE